MKTKTVREIFRCVCFLGFLLVLGTAGASDCNNIGLAQIAIQCTIGMVMMAVGAYLGGLMQ